MATYVVRIVERDGTVVNTLSDASFEQATWELNGPGSMTFSFGNYDTDGADVDLIAKEVQLLRDGDVIWWGVPTSASATEKKVTVSCKGLLWYFGRRFIGRADRENLLANPEFETGTLDDWTDVNTTATADTSQRILGAKSAKLVQASSMQDAYLTQTVTGFTATEIGTLLTFAGWYRVASAGFLGEALGKFGVVLRRSSGASFIGDGAFHIEGDVAKDTWLRAECTIWVPPNETNDIEVRLYSLGGTIWWDACSLTAMESLFPGDNVDQAEIVEQIVQHLQDPAYDKSDLNIDTDCDPTGVIRTRVYQHADHHNGLRAMEEFTLLEDGLDYEVVITDATPGSAVRTFTTYYPSKGATPTALDFTAASLSSWTLRIDGDAACSSITVLGDSDGPDREEGAAIDSSVFDGVILEDVIQAPPGAAIDSLDERAEEALRLRKISKVLTVVVPASGYIGVVEPGDRGTPTLAEGFSTISGDWRLASMTVTAADHLTMALNPA